MEELTKVRKVIDRLAPKANVESLLVLDSTQGQNGLSQAMAFAKSAKLTGVVITKIAEDSPINYLQTGDIIVEAQKTKIINVSDLERVVKKVLNSNQKTIQSFDVKRFLHFSFLFM